jgi:hypothetical protein
MSAFRNPVLLVHTVSRNYLMVHTVSRKLYAGAGAVAVTLMESRILFAGAVTVTV